MFEARCRNLLILLTALPFTLPAQNPSPGRAVVVEKENHVEAQTHNEAWKPASIGQSLEVRDRLRTGEFSRAAVRFTDLSMLRVDELTTVEISPPTGNGGRQTLDVKQGGTYFFSRDKAQEIQIRTPAANGALRGTEFELRVAANGRTRLTMFDGEVDIGNAHGRVLLRSGEQAEIETGRAPRKTAVIEAVNVIQWCLYYPAVLDPVEFTSLGSKSSSIYEYRQGDLPGALEAYIRKPVANSIDGRLYRAAVILAVGQVDKARATLTGVPASDSRRKAIEKMIAAVTFQPCAQSTEPSTSSEWMAQSYFEQSRSNLEAALQAARKATELSPEFGFAWARVAELEFSFGRTLKAMKVLERALELAPKNAQAHTLQGFLLSAENRMGAARRSFDSAISLDGALGNAWLGRGLTSIRKGDTEAGRHDLHTAAVLEPNRSIFRSYLGKAFSQEGINTKANLELDRAKELDPNDPTPWLYSAIQRKQENRYNEAIDDLEKSVALNENRRVYRSQFLLDQDRAIRGANLASIYQKDGMIDQSVREAVRAVNSDYASAPAHLFLADSYNALRDPTRILLRYEAAWSSELLLANLLSPIGGGSLSQFVSQQEYSKLFEKDGFGISSLTEWTSDGRFRELGSQFGQAGNLSYALDAEYYYDNGRRPNNSVSRFEGYATFKLQLSPQDSLFFQTKMLDFEGGDLLQRYDQDEVGRETTIEVPTETGGLHKVVTKNVPALTYDFREKQEPGRMLAGWHHEWSPGNHTLLVAGRLANDLEVTDQDTQQLVLQRDVLALVPPGFDLIASDPALVRDAAFYSLLTPLLGKGRLRQVNRDIFDLDYRASFEIYNVELQQIATIGPNTAVFGARYQSGDFDTHVRLTDYANGLDTFGAPLFQMPPASQDVSSDFNRLSLYFYDTLRPTRWLTLTGGIVYESMEYPENFQNPPISDRQNSVVRVLPKVGATIQPWAGATIRGAYMEALGGVSTDENIRLEPTQVAGFLQSFRSLAPESILGPIAGSVYKISGLSLEQKLPTRTYLGVEYQVLTQDADRTIGVFDSLGGGGIPFANLPSSVREKDSYREAVLTATINQLVGDCWSFGGRYRYTHSKLRQQRGGYEDALEQGLKDDFVVMYNGGSLAALAADGDRLVTSDLHELNLFALYNHPSGLFGRFEANWYRQQNDNFIKVLELPLFGTTTEPRPRVHTRNLGNGGDRFWQFNISAGYRFHRDQCEISLGLLNLTGEGYNLDPLTPNVDLPRDRTLFVRCKLTF